MFEVEVTTNKMCVDLDPERRDADVFQRSGTLLCDLQMRDHAPSVFQGHSTRVLRVDFIYEAKMKSGIRSEGTILPVARKTLPR